MEFTRASSCKCHFLRAVCADINFLVRRQLGKLVYFSSSAENARYSFEDDSREAEQIFSNTQHYL